MTTSRQSLTASSFLLSPERKAELEKKIEQQEVKPIEDEIVLSNDTKQVLDIVKNAEQQSSLTENENEEEEGKDEFHLEVDTPLTGKKTFGKKAKEEPNVELSENDSYYKYLLMDLGEKDKDPKTLAKDIKQSIEKASKYDEVEKKATTYEEFFLSMPEDLKAINTAYMSNKDYKSLFKEFSESKLDYNKDVSFYRDIELVEAYKSKMPKSVQNNDFDDLDEAVQESAIILAKEYFNREKNEVVNKADEIRRKNELFLEKYNLSIDASLNSYQQVANLDSNKKSKLKKLMQEDLLSAFYNKDGTYREDAAERLAFALYGKETVDTYEAKLNEAIERVKNRSMSAAREEVIKTSDSTVKQNSGMNDVQQVDAEKRKQLTSFIKKTSSRTF